MLYKKVVAPIDGISKRSERAENDLFLRLNEVAREQPLVLDCSVQQAGEDFITILSDHESGDEVCAWSGSADGVVAQFEEWLSRRFPGSLQPPA